MALHTPTDWDFTSTDDDISPGLVIKASTIDQIVQNQQYSAERGRMICSMMFDPLTASGSATAFDNIWVTGPNLLGLTATIAPEWYVKAWSNDGSTQFRIDISNTVSGYGTDTVTVTVSPDTEAWHNLGGSMTTPSDGSHWYFDLDITRTAGSGEVYCAGLAGFYLP